MGKQPFEKLGAFYLGRVQDLETDATTPETVMYDSRDLTTHALCVGMTGSGKTGLGVALLEEAAIDGIPAIVVDPKGDLGNLLLTFPELRPGDFRPWIEDEEAVRHGQTADQYSQQVAQRWRDGLAQWGQDGERIGRFCSSVDRAIYSPGSSAGLPLAVLKSFDAPPQAVVDDPDSFRDRVTSATSGLLALLGLDIDPVRSREFILVSNLLDRAWRERRDMDIACLIREIQSPPFEMIGVMDVDSFYPAKERMALSMTLNSLLASPSFASWLEGEPLDIKRLLHTPAGKPRISIVSIAHLSEPERMFFVTILLNELLTWVRCQAGTPSLRALFYMDEVFGYFPPVANPPSKQPMLTLLKQARAYGLGLVLATQNPVDLDYKGLSNCGTWFLGRLQTVQDKARVLDGLEGASTQSGTQFDRQHIDKILSGLGGRVFLMNNVHEDQPVVFHTRWAMSYLRGPLTRDQIRTLMADHPERIAQKPEPAQTAPAQARPEQPPASQPPTDRLPNGPEPSVSETAISKIPTGISQRFVKIRGTIQKGADRLVYRPALLGVGTLHFVRTTYHLDHWEPRSLTRQVDDGFELAIWEGAEMTRPGVFETSAVSEALFAEPPIALALAENYQSWQRQLKQFLYQTQTLSLWRCASLKQYSRPGEAEDDFRIRLAQFAREQRDLKVEKLRHRYAAKMASLRDQIRRARESVSREKSQYHEKSLDTAISVGASIFGALFGRKVLSRTNVDRASSEARRVGKIAREKEDVKRAEQKLQSLEKDQEALEQEIASQIAQIDDTCRPDVLQLKLLEVKPRKSDIQVEPITLLWTPWWVDDGGNFRPAS